MQRVRKPGTSDEEETFLKLIMITNDDGIRAEGMARLAAEAAKYGEVWVVAPDGQRSAASHSITLHGHVDIFPSPYSVEGVKAFSCSGTPADCVRTGSLYVLPRKPDVVLSGINYGLNVASDLQYSATAGAALEAAFQGIPAIAFSEKAVELHETADHYLPLLLKEFLEEIFADDAPSPLPAGAILNVNFPGCPLAECRGVMRNVAVSDGMIFRDHYKLLQKLPGEGRRLMVEGVRDERSAEGSDLWAVTHGYVSVGVVRNVG